MAKKQLTFLYIKVKNLSKVKAKTNMNALVKEQKIGCTKDESGVWQRQKTNRTNFLFF